MLSIGDKVEWDAYEYYDDGFKIDVPAGSGVVVDIDKDDDVRTYCVYRADDDYAMFHVNDNLRLVDGASASEEDLKLEKGDLEQEVEALRSEVAELRAQIAASNHVLETYVPVNVEDIRPGDTVMGSAGVRGTIESVNIFYGRTARDEVALTANGNIFKRGQNNYSVVAYKFGEKVLRKEK